MCWHATKIEILIDFQFLPLQSNISLILHAVGEYELSLRFLEHALALNIKYHGPKSLKVAVSYHLVARTQSCMGDFRSALNSEKETFSIYKQQVSRLESVQVATRLIDFEFCSSATSTRRRRSHRSAFDT